MRNVWKNIIILIGTVSLTCAIFFIILDYSLGKNTEQELAYVTGVVYIPERTTVTTSIDSDDIPHVSIHTDPEYWVVTIDVNNEYYNMTFYSKPRYLKNESVYVNSTIGKWSHIKYGYKLAK